MTKCDLHNWLHDEFNEPCPLCEAAQAEQQRIITLLEELIPAKPTYQMPMEYWVQCKLVKQAIALIKGEK
jgi:hypothetical protein